MTGMRMARGAAISARYKDHAAPVDPPEENPNIKTAVQAMGVYRGNYDGPNRIAMFESPDGINRTLTGPIVDFCGKGQSTWSARTSVMNDVINDWDGLVVTGGYTLSFSVSPYPGGFGGSLAEAAAGDFDAEYTADANRLSAAGYDATNLIIRPMWEFNGKFYPWTIRTDASTTNRSGTNQTTNCNNFKTTYQRMVDRYRAVIPGLRFDWCPLRGQSSQTIMDQCYPGDDYVDIIGLDAYNWGQGTTDVAARFLTLYGENATYVGLYWQMQYAIAHGKTCSFPEWGITDNTNDGASGGGGDDPYYITSMGEHFDTLGAQGLLAYHAYFEYDASDGNHQLHSYNGDASYSGTHIESSPKGVFYNCDSTVAFDNYFKAA